MCDFVGALMFIVVLLKEHTLEDPEEFNRIQLRYKRANQVTELLNTDNEEISRKLVDRNQIQTSQNLV